MAWKSKKVGLTIYTSTLWIWIRGGASLVPRCSAWYTYLHRGSQTIQMLTQSFLTWASVHVRLDKVMQCKFMKISWTISLFFLTFYSLSDNLITDECVCKLVRELQVNQSHQKLEWVQPFMPDFLRGACWDCCVIPTHVHWNIREGLHVWWQLQTLSYTFGTTVFSWASTPPPQFWQFCGFLRFSM